MFTKTQNRLLGTQWPLQGVVLPITDRAKQNRVRFLGQLQGRFWQRVSVCFVASATHWRALHLEFLAERVQNFQGLINDLGTDAVTRQNCDFHGM